MLLTDDGRSMTGMIASETANSVTLRRAEDATDTVQRERYRAAARQRPVDHARGPGKANRSGAAMADLLAYLLQVPCEGEGRDCSAHVAAQAISRAISAAQASRLPASALDASTRPQAATPRIFRPGNYVDVHTHLGQTWNTTEPLSAARAAQVDGRRIEIAQAVVLPLVSPESSSYLLTTDFVLAETKPHRDRLIPFCCDRPAHQLSRRAERVWSTC